MNVTNIVTLPAAGHNNVATLDDAINDANSIGVAEGETGNMKHELMLRLARYAATGAVSVAGADVERVADAYFQGKKGATFAPGSRDFNEGSFKKSVSQFRAVARCGAHPCERGVETLEKAVDIAADFRRREADFRKSIFQSVVDVAVAQNKSEVALTPEDIADVIFPKKEDEAYDLAKRVEQLRKTCANIISGSEKDGEVIKPAAASIDAKTAKALEAALKSLDAALAAAADKASYKPAK